MRFFRARSAFSLIEVLVVISITALLTSMAVAYSRTSGRQVSLFTEQARVAGVLNRAKSLALNRYSTVGASPVCGVGVLFDRSASPHRLVIFADASSCDNAHEVDEEIAGEAHDLGPHVEIKEPTGQASIVFKLPYLEVVPASGLTVVLESTLGVGTVSVEVSGGGGVTMR